MVSSFYTLSIHKKLRHRLNPLIQIHVALRYVVITCCVLLLSACGRSEFTEREKAVLQSLSIDKLAMPSAESNQYAFNDQARQLGEALFHEKQLSGDNQFSCASCHLPDKFFTDGLPTGVAAGTTTRNTPALHGVAWFTWFYWDGRRDSLWSQALTPIEAANEMNSDRIAVTQLIANTQSYRQQYESIFGKLPFNGNEKVFSISAAPTRDKEQRQRWAELPENTKHKINTVFANIGKALAAYQYTLQPLKTRFDLFIDEVRTGKKINQIKTLDKNELKGALLFLNEKKTQCIECHNGPLLTNDDFHNIATGNITGPVFDFGREYGLQSALLDEFNCQGRYSDADPDDCLHLIYLSRDALHMRGAFRTPSLRNISNTGPYFHDGRFDTLEEVVRFYANPPTLERAHEHELRPGFELEEDEIISLSRFLETFEAVQQ